MTKIDICYEHCPIVVGKHLMEITFFFCSASTDYWVTRTTVAALEATETKTHPFSVIANERLFQRIARIHKLIDSSLFGTFRSILRNDHRTNTVQTQSLRHRRCVPIRPTTSTLCYCETVEPNPKCLCSLLFFVLFWLVWSSRLCSYF